MTSSSEFASTPAEPAGHDAPAPADGLPPVVVALCRGVLHRDAAPRHWQSLLDLAPRVRDYVSVLGLDLMIDEAEGYAYLAQRSADQGATDNSDDTDLARLISRRQLSYPVSLVLALLRKKLAEHDATSGEPRLIVTREQIVETLRVFLPDAANEARLLDRIDAHINKTVELGMLRRLRATSDNTTQRFEVQRILKAFVDAQWLNELDARLAEYRGHIDPDSLAESRAVDG